MKKKQDWLLFGLYFAFGLFVVLNHEPWRDEFQSWLIARESDSIAALFTNSIYEGHHSGWYLVLWVLTSITESILAFQLFHFFITAVGIFILIKWSPFSNIEKWLLTFNYFFFFEYGVIARHYGITLTLVFLFCALFKYRHTKFHWILSVLFLLLFINIYSFFISFSFFVMLIIEKLDRGDFSKIDWALILGFVIAIGVSIVDVKPPADSGYAEGWDLVLRDYLKSPTILWNSFVPIPKNQLHFWSKNFFDFENRYLKYCIKLILLTPILLFIIKKISKSYYTFFFFFLLYGINCFFSSAKFYGVLRHHGCLFIAFIAALWIQAYLPENINSLKFKFIEKGRNIISEKVAQNTFYFILVLHCFVTIFAVQKEIQYDFSGGKRLSEYIISNNLNDLTIIGDSDFSASTLSAFLDKEIYYPSSDRFGTFVTWTKKWSRKHDKRTEESVLLKADSLRIVKDQKVLVLLNYEIKEKTLFNRKDIKPLYASPPGIIGSEEYFLYMILN